MVEHSVYILLPLRPWDKFFPLFSSRQLASSHFSRFRIVNSFSPLLSRSISYLARRGDFAFEYASSETSSSAAVEESDLPGRICVSGYPTGLKFGQGTFKQFAYLCDL